MIVLAESDQMAVGAEVGLDARQAPAVPADDEAGEGALARVRRLATDLDLVSVARISALRGLRQGEGLEAAGGEQVGCQGERLAAGREVGKRPVDAAVGQISLGLPGAVGAQYRVEVLEVGEVAADDDQMHRPFVLDVVVVHGRPGGIHDAEAQLGTAGVEARLIGNHPVAGVGRGEAGEGPGSRSRLMDAVGIARSIRFVGLHVLLLMLR